MTSGIPGSDYEPRADTEIRLARWRRLASDGVPVVDIAAALGIKRATLDQITCRARRHGHPDAIRHPFAGSEPGNGVSHVVNRGARARRRPPAAPPLDKRQGAQA